MRPLKETVSQLAFDGQLRADLAAFRYESLTIPQAGRIARLTGTDRSASEWMKRYRDTLENVRYGVQEATAHRRDIYLGDKFDSSNGALVQDGNGRFAYQLASIDTPQPETSLHHVYQVLAEGVVGKDAYKVLPWQTEKVRAMILREARKGKSRNIRLNSDWKVFFSIDPKAKDRLYPRINTFLQPAQDAELDKIVEERKAEAKKKEELAELTDAIEAKRLDRLVKESVDGNYLTESIELGYFDPDDNISPREALDTIVAGGQWQEVPDDLPTQLLASKHPVDVKDQKYAAFLTSMDDSNKRILTVEVNREGRLSVKLVLSKYEIDANMLAFGEKFKEAATEEIEKRMKEAYTNAKYGVGEADLSPTEIADSALKVLQQEHLRNEEYDEIRGKAAHDFLTWTVDAIVAKAPSEIGDFLRKWLDAAENNTRLNYINGVALFNENAHYYWDVEDGASGVVGMPKITYKVSRFDKSRFDEDAVSEYRRIG